MRVKFKNESDRLGFLKSQYNGRVTKQKIFYGKFSDSIGSSSLIKIYLDEFHSSFRLFSMDQIIDVQKEQLEITKKKLIIEYLS